MRNGRTPANQPRSVSRDQHKCTSKNGQLMTLQLIDESNDRRTWFPAVVMTNERIDQQSPEFSAIRFSVMQRTISCHGGTTFLQVLLKFTIPPNH